MIRSGTGAGRRHAGRRQEPARRQALYLFKDGKDTLYRIHGTTEPWSIGEAVSSGCIRMLNQDVIDLHRRVPTGTKVGGARVPGHRARCTAKSAGDDGSLGNGASAGLTPDDGLDHAGLDNLSRNASEAPEPPAYDREADDDDL